MDNCSQTQAFLPMLLSGQTQTICSPEAICHGVPINIALLSAAVLVQAQCHISHDIQTWAGSCLSSRNSGYFPEAIMWMCPETFCQSSFCILRAVQPFLDSSAITEELAAQVQYGHQSALQIFILRLFQCLKDTTAFLHTSYLVVGCVTWFGKQLPDFFFSIPCELKDNIVFS